MKVLRIIKEFTLSSYEPQEYGIGHTVDGNPPKNPSVAETPGQIMDMIKFFKDVPTSTKIRVIMETMEDEE